MAEEPWGCLEALTPDQHIKVNVGDDIFFRAQGEYTQDRAESTREFYRDLIKDEERGRVIRVDRCDQRQPFQIEFPGRDPLWVFADMLYIIE